MHLLAPQSRMARTADSALFWCPDIPGDYRIWDCTWKPVRKAVGKTLARLFGHRGCKSILFSNRACHQSSTWHRSPVPTTALGKVAFVRRSSSEV